MTKTIEIFTCYDCMQKFVKSDIATLEWVQYGTGQIYYAFCKSCIKKKGDKK